MRKGERRGKCLKEDQRGEKGGKGIKEQWKRERQGTEGERKEIKRIRKKEGVAGREDK